jgi:pyridoxal 5'-phosphate synthase pdxT subunit
LDELDGIVLPGGESTAMGLIGTVPCAASNKNMWESLQDFAKNKPVWGTCAGMILLAEKCIGTSAVIQGGQALIGGMDITVVRNYFGSQVSSFEMPTPPPPGSFDAGESFPGIFIRAPAIVSAGPNVQILGKVVATPCRQAAVTLHELEQKIAAGENVVSMGVADALERDSGLRYKVVVHQNTSHREEIRDEGERVHVIALPGAADRTNSREVICATRTGHLLCTAFHPELTDDYRWHQYFLSMVEESMARQ